MNNTEYTCRTLYFYNADFYNIVHQPITDIIKLTMVYLVGVTLSLFHLFNEECYKDSPICKMNTLKYLACGSSKLNISNFL